MFHSYFSIFAVLLSLTAPHFAQASDAVALKKPLSNGQQEISLTGLEQVLDAITEKTSQGYTSSELALIVDSYYEAVEKAALSGTSRPEVSIFDARLAQLKLQRFDQWVELLTARNSSLKGDQTWLTRVVRNIELLGSFGADGLATPHKNVREVAFAHAAQALDRVMFALEAKHFSETDKQVLLHELFSLDSQLGVDPVDHSIKYNASENFRDYMEFLNVIEPVLAQHDVNMALGHQHALESRKRKLTWQGSALGLLAGGAAAIFPDAPSHAQVILDLAAGSGLGATLGYMLGSFQKSTETPSTVKSIETVRHECKALVSGQK